MKATVVQFQKLTYRLLISIIMLASFSVMYGNYFYCNFNLSHEEVEVLEHDHSEHNHSHDTQTHDHQTEDSSDDDCCTDIIDSFFDEAKLIAKQLRIPDLAKFTIANNFWIASSDNYVINSTGELFRYVEPPPPKDHIFIFIQSFII